LFSLQPSTAMDDSSPGFALSILLLFGLLILLILFLLQLYASIRLSSSGWRRIPWAKRAYHVLSLLILPLLVAQIGIQLESSWDGTAVASTFLSDSIHQLLLLTLAVWTISLLDVCLRTNADGKEGQRQSRTQPHPDTPTIIRTPTTIGIAPLMKDPPPVSGSVAISPAAITRILRPSTRSMTASTNVSPSSMHRTVILGAAEANGNKSEELNGNGNGLGSHEDAPLRNEDKAQSTRADDSKTNGSVVLDVEADTTAQATRTPSPPHRILTTRSFPHLRAAIVISWMIHTLFTLAIVPPLISTYDDSDLTVVSALRLTVLVSRCVLHAILLSLQLYAYLWLRQSIIPSNSFLKRSRRVVSKGATTSASIHIHMPMPMSARHHHQHQQHQDPMLSLMDGIATRSKAQLGMPGGEYGRDESSMMTMEMGSFDTSEFDIDPGTPQLAITTHNVDDKEGGESEQAAIITLPPLLPRSPPIGSDGLMVPSPTSPRRFQVSVSPSAAAAAGAAGVVPRRAQPHGRHRISKSCSAFVADLSMLQPPPPLPMMMDNDMHSSDGTSSVETATAEAVSIAGSIMSEDAVEHEATSNKMIQQSFPQRSDSQPLQSSTSLIETSTDHEDTIPQPSSSPSSNTSPSHHRGGGGVARFSSSSCTFSQVHHGGVPSNSSRSSNSMSLCPSFPPSTTATFTSLSSTATSSMISTTTNYNTATSNSTSTSTSTSNSNPISPSLATRRISIATTTTTTTWRGSTDSETLATMLNDNVPSSDTDKETKSCETECEQAAMSRDRESITARIPPSAIPSSNTDMVAPSGTEDTALDVSSARTHHRRPTLHRRSQSGSMIDTLKRLNMIDETPMGMGMTMGANNSITGMTHTFSSRRHARRPSAGPLLVNAATAMTASLTSPPTPPTMSSRNRDAIGGITATTLTPRPLSNRQTASGRRPSHRRSVTTTSSSLMLSPQSLLQLHHARKSTMSRNSLMDLSPRMLLRSFHSSAPVAPTPCDGDAGVACTGVASTPRQLQANPASHIGCADPDTSERERDREGEGDQRMTLAGIRFRKVTYFLIIFISVQLGMKAMDIVEIVHLFRDNNWDRSMAMILADQAFVLCWLGLLLYLSWLYPRIRTRSSCSLKFGFGRGWITCCCCAIFGSRRPTLELPTTSTTDRDREQERAMIAMTPIGTGTSGGAIAGSHDTSLTTTPKLNAATNTPSRRGSNASSRISLTMGASIIRTPSIAGVAQSMSQQPNHPSPIKVDPASSRTRLLNARRTHHRLLSNGSIRSHSPSLLGLSSLGGSTVPQLHVSPKYHRLQLSQTGTTSGAGTGTGAGGSTGALSPPLLNAPASSTYASSSLGLRSQRASRGRLAGHNRGRGHSRSSSWAVDVYARTINSNSNSNHLTTSAMERLAPRVSAVSSALPPSPPSAPCSTDPMHPHPSSSPSDHTHLDLPSANPSVTSPTSRSSHHHSTGSFFNRSVYQEDHPSMTSIHPIPSKVNVSILQCLKEESSGSQASPATPAVVNSMAIPNQHEHHQQQHPRQKLERQDAIQSACDMVTSPNIGVKTNSSNEMTSNDTAASSMAVPARYPSPAIITATSPPSSISIALSLPASSPDSSNLSVSTFGEDGTDHAATNSSKRQSDQEQQQSHHPFQSHLTVPIPPSSPPPQRDFQSTTSPRSARLHIVHVKRRAGQSTHARGVSLDLRPRDGADSTATALTLAASRRTSSNTGVELDASHGRAHMHESDREPTELQ